MTEAALVAELLQEGVAAVKAGRKEEARRTLMQVVELDERNEQGWLWLSGVVETLEDRRVCLENVLAINPFNAHAQAGLNWIEQNAPPPTTVEAAPAAPPVPTAPTTPAAIEEPCPRCLAPVPSSANSCPECGLPLIIACPACGQYADVDRTSCPTCGHYLGDFHEGASYHLALAQTYLDRQQIDHAREAIAHAEAESPNDPRVLEKAAALYEKTGQVDRAIAAYEQAIQADPENAPLYARLGTLYRQNARPDQARAMYQQALEIDSQNTTAMMEYARFRIQEEGATAEVMEMVEQIIEKQPMNALASLLLADLYLSKKRTQQARKFYEHASQLSAPDSDVGREAQRKLAELQPSRGRGTQAGASGLGGAGYSTDFKRPGCLTLYAILTGIAGLFALLGGAAIAVLANASKSLLAEMANTPGMSMSFDPSLISNMFWVLVAAMLIGAAINIAIAIGLWYLKNWARIAVIIVQSLSLLSSICQAVTALATFRELSATYGAQSFPTLSLAWLLFGFVVQGYIIFWFVANREVFD